MKRLLLLSPLLLAGCISFGAKPPASLLTLTPATTIPVGTTQSTASARSFVVAVPNTPASLATARVPVQETATTLSYVKDAAWAEPPARLFARLLSDTLTARGNVVVTGVQPIDSPASTLGGDLRAFGFDGVTRTAVVTYDAVLSRGTQAAAQKRRFEARVPVATIDPATAGTALNDAANQVAAEVAAWAGR